MAEDKGNNSSEQFDITDVETEDLDTLATRIESFYKKDTTQKNQLSYAWERNHMFLDGKQWLVYDGEYNYGGLWKQLTTSRANEYIPRPVTNFIFDNYQTLKSYLIKNKPRSKVQPNTKSYKDKTAAKLADLCLETNWERLKEEYNYEYAASIGLTYGTVIKKSYWDTSATGLVRVPKTQQVPKTDPMTGQMVGMSDEPVLDEFGAPVYEELPLGDVNTCIVEPQRFALDPLANNLHEARWVAEFTIQPLSWIHEVFGKEGDGYTGKAFDVKEETSLNGSLRRYYQLKTSSGVKNKLDSIGSSGTQDGVANSAVVKEYYERPSLKYPKGRMVVVANGVTLYAFNSPYEGPELGDWHPYSEFRYEIVPGRFWGKGPIENGVEIQKRLNSIDSVVVLTRKTMAVPQKLIPTSAGIAHGSWTGRPGQEIFYRDSGGAAPSTIPGVGVDASVFAEREQAKNDLKEVMGAIDILKGDRPPGVTAASALEMLYEVGAGKLYPMLDRWKRFVESDQKKQLRIVAKNYREPREAYIRSLRAKNSDLSDEMINKFIGADLYDNCNVIVEAGSNIPKLLSAQKARLAEAAQTGVLSLEKPENRAEYQKQMGITGFDNDVGPDQRRAEWENDLLDNIDNSPDNMPIVLAVDKDDIHMEVLGLRMKEPSFISATASVQQAYMKHYQDHMDAKAQKDQAAALEAAAMGMPPQGDSSLQPSAPHPAGKGATHDGKKALDADLNQPGME